ncbi:MAG: sensor histidine kinase, partial [Anaerolineae bacterium]
VAHELGTPLHIIRGNLEGILDGVYEPTPEHIHDTLDETHLLSRLVTDLRTLSLAESGQLPLGFEPVDVADLLADVQTSFSGQTEAAGIELQTNVLGEPGALSVMGDVDRLNQVLSNLVVNSLRHTAVGGHIHLRAKPVDEWVSLTIQDNGEGIAAPDLPYIFDRFWRGDRARTHAPGVGGGLGLAIAKQLIQAHHGRIQVTSALGEGTTFTILLPKDTSPAIPAG